jgi:hypothetical protein
MAALALYDSDPVTMIAAPDEESFLDLDGGGGSSDELAFPSQRCSGRRNAVADLGSLLARVGFGVDAEASATSSSGLSSEIDWEGAGVLPPRRGSRHSQRRHAVVDGCDIRDALSRMSDGSFVSG